MNLFRENQGEKEVQENLDYLVQKDQKVLKDYQAIKDQR